GTVGSSAATRLNTSAGTLAANGTSVFVNEADGVTLDTVNTVTNSATATYGVKAGAAMVVTSADVGGGTNAYLETTAGNLTGAGSVKGTNVALKSALVLN